MDGPKQLFDVNNKNFMRFPTHNNNNNQRPTFSEILNCM